jgi:hypothetical protein
MQVHIAATAPKRPTPILLPRSKFSRLHVCEPLVPPGPSLSAAAASGLVECGGCYTSKQASARTHTQAQRAAHDAVALTVSAVIVSARHNSWATVKLRPAGQTQPPDRSTPATLLADSRTLPTLRQRRAAAVRCNEEQMLRGYEEYVRRRRRRRSAGAREQDQHRCHGGDPSTHLSARCSSSLVTRTPLFLHLQQQKYAREVQSERCSRASALPYAGRAGTPMPSPLPTAQRPWPRLWPSSPRWPPPIAHSRHSDQVCAALPLPCAQQRLLQ